MSILFVDCEFNGFGGKLLSMALVADDGREFYEAIHFDGLVDPWVAANVVPVMDTVPLAPTMFRHKMHEFLSHFHRPTVIADWYTDLVHFFDQMAGPDHGSSFDYPCYAELQTQIKYISATPHNALADARAIRDACMKVKAA